MFAFLYRLFFGGTDPSLLSVGAYWCETPLKLSAKVTTPLGSKVTVVNVCVDIWFRVEAGQVEILRAALSGSGGHVMGSEAPINVAAERTGEAWFATAICDEADLVAAAQKDLQRPDSRLRGIMLSKVPGARNVSDGSRPQVRTIRRVVDEWKPRPSQPDRFGIVTESIFMAPLLPTGMYWHRPSQPQRMVDQRIDGIVALIMGLEQATCHVEDNYSFYDDHELEMM